MQSVTIGLDVSDRYSRYCVVNSSGEVVEEGRLRTTREALEQRFSRDERARVVLETGTHSPWMSRTFGELGHEVIVANPRRLRLIYGAETKNDRLDAEHLARLGRLDPKLLAPIQHRGKRAQADLSVLRARDALIRSRTLLVNHVRGAVKSVGGRLPRCSTPSFGSKAAPHLPEELKQTLAPVLETIVELSGRVRGYDRQIERLCEQRYPETRALRQVGGIGPLTSLCYVLTLEDPSRFRTSRAVSPYLGLCPRQRESGQMSPQLRITKAGDVMLRRLLVGSAHHILGPFGPDTDLRRMGLRIAARGGKNAKKRAAVAVARKLAVVLHRLWISGDEYVPLKQGGSHNELAETA